MYLDPIIKCMANTAVRLANEFCLEVSGEAQLALASLADSQYTDVSAYLSSAEFALRRQLLVSARRDSACLAEMGEKRSRLLRLLQRQSDLEFAELESLSNDRERYLMDALAAYCHCLIVSDQFNIKVGQRFDLYEIRYYDYLKCFTIIYFRTTNLATLHLFSDYLTIFG
ncbi:unnamed protein product [Protopolystoma xenopodis]|uniref:Uncharacterized protein n=1 Tax=Protopolystoma xenopodis TaxID=117903 RepID=A0A3S5A3U2_9PLAT|nr:unnamed protein product [Protopolystoma xenopodis]